jgi:hypothetical protein
MHLPQAPDVVQCLPQGRVVVAIRVGGGPAEAVRTGGVTTARARFASEGGRGRDCDVVVVACSVESVLPPEPCALLQVGPDRPGLLAEGEQAVFAQGSTKALPHLAGHVAALVEVVAELEVVPQRVAFLLGVVFA